MLKQMIELKYSPIIIFFIIILIIANGKAFCGTPCLCSSVWPTRSIILKGILRHCYLDTGFYFGLFKCCNFLLIVYCFILWLHFVILSVKSAL